LRPVFLDYKAKPYVDSLIKTYEAMKFTNRTEREIVQYFVMENVAVFEDVNGLDRYNFLKAVQDNNGYEMFRNAMFIYNIATKFIPVEYTKA
jgi:hypothetical protein